MNSYRVSFYKNLLNSSGHSFKCLQRQIDVQSNGPSQALVLAQQLTHSESLEADCVEVVHLTDHHHSEQPAGDPAPMSKHTWSRAS
jgi:hypothetical protein